MFKYIVYLYQVIKFKIHKISYKLGNNFNHIDSPEDLRDFVFGSTCSTSSITKVDLRSQFKDPYHQLSVGSCTANAIAAVYQYTANKQYGIDFMPSRLGLYYDERKIEGTTLKDCGAFIRDGMKVCIKQGLYPEFLWPYDVKNVFIHPPKSCYIEASKHQTLIYEKVPQKLSSICSALNSGLPIVFGFQVYESMMSSKVAATGVLKMPKPTEECLGGHAVVIVGYDIDTKTFIIRNSWGTAWGKKGYFTIPFDYVLDSGLASDFWLMRKVEG